MHTLVISLKNGGVRLHLKKNKIHYAWVILFALCIIRSLSAAGINNTGGLFLKPAADDLGVGVGTLSVYFSISSIASLVFLPIGGKLLQKYPVKLLAGIAIVLQAGSFLALSFLHAVWGWYLFAIPMGIGGAFLVNLLGPILLHRWFFKHAGIALGILMACAGIFGMVFQPLTSAWISEIGWRNTYFRIGLLVLIAVMVILLLFLKDAPEKHGLSPLGLEEGATGAQQAEEKSGITWNEAKRSGTFYFLLLFMVCITAFGSFQQHIATYGYELHYTSGIIGTALALGMAGSTVGAIVIGMVSDRIGAIKTTFCILGVMAGSAAAFLAAGISVSLFMLGSFLLGLAGMGIPVLAPILTKTLFGDKEYAAIYANVMMGAPLATILLLPLYGFIYDATGSYRLVLYLLVVFILIGIFCTFKNKGSKKNTV